MQRNINDDIIPYWLKCVIGPCTFTIFWLWSLHFFCLALVPAVCKKFVISSSVHFKLKKKMFKLTLCHVDQLFHATWHTKRQNFQN